MRLLLIVVGASCCSEAFAQPPLVAHREDVLEWHVAVVSPGTTAGASASFAAFGRRFDLTLERNRRVETRIAAREVRAYRGAVRNAPGSWARIVISADGPAGIIWDGETLYGLAPGTTNSAATIFRADDVIIPAGTMSCGVHEPASDAAALFSELTTQAPEIARAAGATLNMNLGVVADPEFTALHSDPAAAMLVRANNVDGIFSEQIGVQISVEQIDVFADAQDSPFSETSDAEVLLEELSAYRGATPAQDAQALTHLFTGRDLTGSTVGLAYIGAVCSQRSSFDPEGRSFGTGLTQANRGVAGALIESLIAAHEFGHNFGAPHDGEEGACLSAPPGYVMATMLSPAADRFSQCSVDVISGNLDSMSCLTPIPVVDLAIEGRSDAAAALSQTPFDFTVEVSNQGLEAAANTIVQLAFDPEISVLDIAPQSGTCGPAQQNIDCNLGEIPGSSARTISVTVQSDVPGEHTIAGNVTATDDVNTANDAFAVSVHVAQASDLALIASPQTLNLDEASGIAVTLANRSGLAATEIAVTGSYSIGLEVDEVAYAGAVCGITAAARTFACQIADLGGFSDGTIAIVLRGVETGSAELTLAVSAEQADPNIDDNSARIDLQVSANAPTPAGDGGGGGLGPAALLALLGAWARRRRRASTQGEFFLRSGHCAGDRSRLESGEPADTPCPSQRIVC